MSLSHGPVCCLICSEPAFTSLENKLLTSTNCGHKVCKKCLQVNQQRASVPEPIDQGPHLGTLGTRPPPSGNGGSKGHGLGAPQQSLECPLCHIVTLSNDWVDREPEEALLEQEKLVRQRIFAVFNSTRPNFDATPAYNDYLEHREEMVFELTFGTDPIKKKQFQEELQTSETENQKQIVECRQQALRDEQEEIRQIVEKEGVFYELVKQNFGPGFRYVTTRSQDLLHPLQRAHPELFGPLEADQGTEVIDRPAATLGAGGQPKPLQSGLDYLKLPKRQPTDKAAMLRACGLSKEKIGQRILEELWGGLERVANI